MNNNMDFVFSFFLKSISHNVDFFTLSNYFFVIPMLPTYTVDNPFAKARELSPRTGGQT